MLETMFPMGYTPLEITLRAITEFDHSCPLLLSIHTGPSFGKAFFLFIMTGSDDCEGETGFPGGCKRKSHPNTLVAITGTANHMTTGISKRFCLPERYSLDVRRSSANLVAAPARTKSKGMI